MAKVALMKRTNVTSTNASGHDTHRGVDRTVFVIVVRAER